MCHKNFLEKIIFFLMKVIKVFYKDTCQEFSAADGTTSDEIYQLMKRIFHIKEDISDFFLQDSEGRIVILPKCLPDELCVYLYVRTSYENSNDDKNNKANLSIKQPNDLTTSKRTNNNLMPLSNQNDQQQQLPSPIDLTPSKRDSDDLMPLSNQNDLQQQSILKTTNIQTECACKWVFKCVPGTEAQLVGGTRYCYINSPDEHKIAGVVSSIEFTKNKHFCIIKVDSHGCGRIGLGEPDQPIEYLCPRGEYYGIKKPFSYLREERCDQLTKLTGLALDCKKKIGYFIKVNPVTYKPIKILKKVTDLPKSVIIFAAFKGFECIRPPFTGITLIKNSLPFPDLEDLIPDITVSWNEENQFTSF